MEKIYPQFTVHPNTAPNKLYAIPLIGMLVKIVILIPVFLWIWVVSLGWVVLVMFVNPLVVLVTGKYLRMAFEVNRALMILSVKTNLFLYGVSDKYPGFSFEKNEAFELEIDYPESANRFYAIPILGFLIRIVLLIPYFLVMNVISNAVAIGVFLGAWIDVLFRGNYPESMYEFVRDSVRLNLSSTMYLSGLTEKYPSFSISWNHRNIKIALIILAIVFGTFNLISDIGESRKGRTTINQEYNYTDNSGDLQTD